MICSAHSGPPVDITQCICFGRSVPLSIFILDHKAKKIVFSQIIIVSPLLYHTIQYLIGRFRLQEIILYHVTEGNYLLDTM